MKYHIILIENRDNNKEEKSIKPKITEDKGLNISYDPEELKKQFPNLTSEIIQQEKVLNIDSVKHGLSEENADEILYKENLSNPGVLDFLRRCSNSEQAMEILEYMKDREEIDSELYYRLKEKIIQEGGLENLIASCGGPKKPGYYIDKYYNDEIDE